jgi:hypothetical protein
MPTCKVPNCDSLARIHGVCSKHYQRFQKYGAYDGGKRNHAPPEERFWRFVVHGKEYDCWLWRGARNPRGYGQIKISENPARYKLAHRLSYEIHKGPLGPNENIVRHSCDTPLCVNPYHLQAGTQADNIADMMIRGRYRCGERKGTKNGRALMTPDDVHKIRQSGESYAKLAEMCGVSKATIAAIVTRRNWSHID